MKKFWKWASGSLHGATYTERPTVGKLKIHQSTRVTTRKSTSTATTRGGVEMSANEPMLPTRSNARSRR